MRIEKRHGRRVLEGAHRLLTKYENWARGAFAYNQYGIDVSPLDETAERWCSSGALEKLGEGHPNQKFKARCALEDAAIDMGYNSIEKCNDHGGYWKAMEMFDRALTEMKRDDPKADIGEGAEDIIEP